MTVSLGCVITEAPSHIFQSNQLCIRRYTEWQGAATPQTLGALQRVESNEGRCAMCYELAVLSFAALLLTSMYRPVAVRGFEVAGGVCRSQCIVFCRVQRFLVAAPLLDLLDPTWSVLDLQCQSRASSSPY